jgi:cobalt/nickel transport system permease protein
MVALPFALAAITLPFTVPGETLVVAPIFGGLTLSVEGVVRFVSILTKSWISVQMAILLVTVTSFPDLLWSLRALHIPQPLVAIVSFMYRYLFVLADEVLRMLRARAARCATAHDLRSGGTLWWRGKVAGQMAGSLMIRSFERSERIYSAMLARGYRGQIHVLEQPHLHRGDFLALGMAVILFAGILAGAYR